MLIVTFPCGKHCKFTIFNMPSQVQHDNRMIRNKVNRIEHSNPIHAQYSNHNGPFAAPGIPVDQILSQKYIYILYNDSPI